MLPADQNGSRGRGGGRGGGAPRGARRNPLDSFDVLSTRPLIDGKAITKKANVNAPGTSKIVPTLEANYFRIESQPDWHIYHYRADFTPEETDTRIKKKLVRDSQKVFGGREYVFDGSSLYIASRLNPDPFKFVSKKDHDNEKVEVSLRLVGQLSPTDPQMLQLFNIILRKCLELIGMEEMGRHFFDYRQSIKLEAQRLELWPGVKTSMRHHEQGILLNVDITHKVIRKDSCLQFINNSRNRNQTKDALVGVTVMTIYNRKTYRVDDIDWETTPKSTFDMRGRTISFIDYFKEKYGLIIKDGNQPMLVSRPRKRDFHRGMTGPINLIPELCQMTGISEEMRRNFNLMRAMATHLHTDPAQRVVKLKEFIAKVKGNLDVQKELKSWGLGINSKLVEFKGHSIEKEPILFGNGSSEMADSKYDWGNAFRNKPLLSTVPLERWVVLVPARDSSVVGTLVGKMQTVARPLSFAISSPVATKVIGNGAPGDYARGVEQVMNEQSGNVQMIFAILPKQANDTYAAFKQRTCKDFGVQSQCFVAKNAYDEKRIMSVCTKLVVQMSAKIGGEPWTIKIPVQKLMVIGFDVYHCGKRKGTSVGAMVATTSAQQTKYFSCVSFHQNSTEMSDHIGTDFRKCIMAYSQVNGGLPARIIMYRDGVGAGQLKHVYDTELGNMQNALKDIYEMAGLPLPKFSFIVVTKRINTRLFASDGKGQVNPQPGTIADDVITLPERYDFYLVSQYARQGTVSPVAYNVLYDTQGLDPDKMQKLTFKLCHLYYNWSGTVSVPAPCQYAHKLAYLTGTSLGGRSHEKLSNTLYFL